LAVKTSKQLGSRQHKFAHKHVLDIQTTRHHPPIQYFCVICRTHVICQKI